MQAPLRETICVRWPRIHMTDGRGYGLYPCNIHKSIQQKQIHMTLILASIQMLFEEVKKENNQVEEGSGSIRFEDKRFLTVSFTFSVWNKTHNTRRGSTSTCTISLEQLGGSFWICPYNFRLLLNQKSLRFCRHLQMLQTSFTWIGFRRHFFRWGWRCVLYQAIDSFTWFEGFIGFSRSGDRFSCLRFVTITLHANDRRILGFPSVILTSRHWKIKWIHV